MEIVSLDSKGTGEPTTIPALINQFKWKSFEKKKKKIGIDPVTAML